MGTALPTDLTANNVDDNNTAFSLQNAMVVAGEYVLGVRGAAFPDIDVIFPGPGSFYDGTALNMLQGDRFDWDVMLHEYGHYVADELNIENNPGGSHSSSSNLSVTRGSKTIGIPLAFGEGWPTYFAVSLLSEMGTAALNIPNIGDTSYQDTEDQVITEDLETGGTLGEDNELTVMSTLWDLYDSVDDGVDRVSLGSSAIWNLLDANDPTTLSAAYQLFAPDTGDASDGASCIFGQYNVSPVVTTPPTDDLGAGSPSPALSWTAGNGGTFFNDSFVVEYRTTAGGLLFASPTLAATTYQAGASDWAAIKAASGGTVVVTVLGTQTAAPVTGAYRSCRRTFAVEVVNPTTTTTTSTTTTTTTTTSTTVPDSTTTTSTTVPDSTTTTSTTVPDSTTTTSTTVPDSTTTTSTTVPDSTTTTSTTVPDSTTTTSTTVPVSTTTTTVPDSTTTSTVPGTTPTTTPPTVPGTTPTTTGPTTTTTPGTPTTDPGPDTTVGTDPTTTVVVPPTDGTPATSVPGDVSGGGVDDGGGVSGGGRALPRTGSDSSTPVTVGLVLVALGAGFALVARRRRTLA